MCLVTINSKLKSHRFICARKNQNLRLKVFSEKLNSNNKKNNHPPFHAMLYSAKWMSNEPISMEMSTHSLFFLFYMEKYPHTLSTFSLIIAFINGEPWTSIRWHSLNGPSVALTANAVWRWTTENTHRSNLSDFIIYKSYLIINCKKKRMHQEK